MSARSFSFNFKEQIKAEVHW